MIVWQHRTLYRQQVIFLWNLNSTMLYITKRRYISKIQRDISTEYVLLSLLVGLKTHKSNNCKPSIIYIAYVLFSLFLSPYHFLLCRRAHLVTLFLVYCQNSEIMRMEFPQTFIKVLPYPILFTSWGKAHANQLCLSLCFCALWSINQPSVFMLPKQFSPVPEDQLSFIPTSLQKYYSSHLKAKTKVQYQC